MLALLPFVLAQAPDDGRLATRWQPTSVQDLHREYSNIFRHGNRNAASHLWSSFILDRAADVEPSLFEMMFSGFCAVSGSPTRPGDYTRYRLSLPLVAKGGLRAAGYLYYCCWPCVCDTQDFIRVDTRNVTNSDGVSRRYHFAVVGNPCDDVSALRVPFSNFGRSQSTLEREAPEVRCVDGVLQGATLSDHGYPIISMFFDAVEETGGDSEPSAALATATSSPQQPGRISKAVDGTAYQDESEFSDMCANRAANGYNSGMGEIFRRVASIAPIQIQPSPPSLGNGDGGRRAEEQAALEEAETEAEAENSSSACAATPPAAES